MSRHEQDEFAALSHQRAAKAHQDGMYKDEIVPVDGNVMENGIKVRIATAGNGPEEGRNAWEKGSRGVDPLNDNVFVPFLVMTVFCVLLLS